MTVCTAPRHREQLWKLCAFGTNYNFLKFRFTAYSCETQALTLGREQRRRAFGNRMLVVLERSNKSVHDVISRGNSTSWRFFSLRTQKACSGYEVVANSRQWMIPPASGVERGALTVSHRVRNSNGNEMVHRAFHWSSCCEHSNRQPVLKRRGAY